MFCSLKTNRALVSQLQLEVENLKTELASTKTALKESNVQALTEEMLEVKASMALLLKEGNRSTTSSGPVTGGVREKGAVSSNCKQPWNVVVGRRKGTNGKGGSGTHMPSKNSGSKRDSHASTQSHKNAASGGDNLNKEVFAGVRRIWGTMKACTAPTVTRSITRLTDVGRNVQVTWKYKTNSEGKIVRWWYILHAEEAVLKKLEQEWERVQLQTAWKLEPSYKHPSGSPHQETAPAIQEQQLLICPDSPAQATLQLNEPASLNVSPIASTNLDSIDSLVNSTSNGSCSNAFATADTPTSPSHDCNPVTPSSLNPTVQPLPTSPFLGGARGMLSPPNQ